MITTGIEKINLVKEYAIDVLHENEERSVYHNIGWFHRIERYIDILCESENLPDELKDLIRLSFYVRAVHQSSSTIKKMDFEKFEEHQNMVSDEVAAKFELGDELKNEIKEILSQTMYKREATRIEAKILRETGTLDFASKKGRDYLKRFYDELLIRDFDLPRSNWYDNLISFLSDAQIYTEYGKKLIAPKKDKLLKQLKKERKELENRTSMLLKKELDISEEELKKLKKDIDKAKNRDERGIQTLFRTTIKNHYTLNEMVDRKANIMITVNSIILSLLMGGIIGRGEGLGIYLIPETILGLTCIFSIVFAIIAIRPLRTQGDFTEEEIRNKEGNLLYYGNFHNMHFRDFEWGFLQMLNDKNYLYGSMIRDFYYQGVGLHRKYHHIRWSLTIFLFGFGAAFIGFLTVQHMSMH